MMFSAYDRQYKTLNPEYIRYLALSFHERKKHRIANGKPVKYKEQTK